MDLSIVIPAYNEETKIAGDIQNCLQYFKSEELEGEIIVVDDGSSDSTPEIAAEFAKQLPDQVRLIELEGHCGKGMAVKTGILAAEGEFIMFADSGSCVPLSYATVGVELIKSGSCDVANGSRKMKESIVQRPHPFSRRVISKVMRYILIVWIGLPRRFTDTQCGFKIYRGNVAKELYGECIKKGFLFDVEIIMRALKKGYRVTEFPIEWRADLDSRLSPVKHLVGVIRELFELAKIVRNL